MTVHHQANSRREEVSHLCSRRNSNLSKLDYTIYLAEELNHLRGIVRISGLS